MKNVFPIQVHLKLVLVVVFVVVPLASPSFGEVTEGQIPSGSHFQEYQVLEVPFGSSFILKSTDDVIAYWDSTDFRDFMVATLDSNATNSADIFPILQEYFLWGGVDQDTTYGGLDLPGKISVYLYTDGDTTDCPGVHGSSCAGVDTSAGVNWVQVYVDTTGTEVANGWAYGHELGHVLWYVNNGTQHPIWANEFHATLAEYVVGNRWSDFEYSSNQFYDRSFLSVAYYKTRLFGAYMMEHFSGGVGIEDDLCYNWLREAPNYGKWRGMLQLGDVLDSLYSEYPNTYPDVTGSTASELAGALHHRFAMALYANSESLDGGKYGFGSEVSARDHKLFEWIDTSSHQARSIAPHFMIGPDASPFSPLVLSEFVATGQHTPTQWSEYCRTRDLGMRKWASEHVVLRSDPSYFTPSSGRSTTLNITLASEDVVDTSLYSIRVGYLAYASSDSVLYDETPLYAVETVAVEYDSNDSLETSFSIPDFGDSVKSVVIIASLATDPVDSNQTVCLDTYCKPPVFDCWGCSTSGHCKMPEVYIEMRCELGNVLDVGVDHQTVQAAIDSATAGDYILVSALPLGPTKEVVVNKALTVINGTTSPLVFAKQTQILVNDAAFRGITFDADTDPVVDNSGMYTTFDDCVFVGDGTNLFGIEGVDHLTVRNSTFSGFSLYGLRSAIIVGGSACSQGEVVIEGCTFDSCGVRVDDCLDRFTFDQNTINGADYGLFDLPDSSFVTRSVFSNCDELITTSCPAVFEDNIAYNYNSTDCTVDFNDNLDEDPLFCGSREGSVGEYTLRWDSPALPGNNTWGVQLGAQTVECAWDTLQRSSVVPQNTTVTVLEDVIIPTSLSLTINAGVTVQFDPDDESSSGRYPSTNELTILGDLIAGSAAGIPVTFTSSAQNPSAGDWGTMEAADACSVAFVNGVVEYADYGVFHHSDTPENAYTDITFRHNDTYDFRAQKTAGGVNGPKATLDGCTLEAAGVYGANIGSQGDDIAFTDCTFSGDSGPLGGLKWGSSSGTVEDCTFTGFSGGRAILNQQRYANYRNKYILREQVRPRVARQCCRDNHGLYF